MSLMGWGKSKDDSADAAAQSQAGVNAINQSYNQAAAYMSPYTNNAGNDFDTARNAVYGAAGNVVQQGNPNAGVYNLLNYNPSQILNHAESGYTMSPFAQQQEQAANAIMTNKLGAQGLEGSGVGDMEHAEISNAIMGQDQQQYLSNLSKSFDSYLRVLGIDDKQRSDVMNAFGKMVGLENKSSTRMADISQRSGEEEANVYKNQARLDEQQARLDSQRQPIAQLANIVGTGIEGYNLWGHSGGGSSPWTDPNYARR
ncbi:hypothetical protein [Nitrospira sp. BLG_2]|uniref:hypothetical protein n=1 Tax=Nitrospira sp. BLG_2 TaxID=3397507 RepID=UPI003B9978DB